MNGIWHWLLSNGPGAAGWIFTSVILVFLLSYMANLAVLRKDDISETLVVSFLRSLFGRTHGWTMREYLRIVIEDNRGLNPTGIHSSQALISVNVPLNEIFIHLNAVSDRPLYDVPLEQQKMLAELRRALDASRSQEDREDYEYRIAQFHGMWAGDIGRTEARAKQSVEIDDVVQRMSVNSPVAFLLGIPGSGKSTTMRWLALQMALAFRIPAYQYWFNTLIAKLAARFERTPRFWGYHPPAYLSPVQIPLLFRISYYAKYLSEPGVKDRSFYTYFKDFMSKKCPDLPGLDTFLEKQLRNGSCLVLFDGLDEGIRRPQRPGPYASRRKT